MDGGAEAVCRGRLSASLFGAEEAAEVAWLQQVQT